MRSLIVYESVYGNTEKIAQAIAGELKNNGDVKMLRIGTFDSSELDNLDLLVVGSPTQWNKPMPSIQNFLNKIESNALKAIVFDTRLSSKLVGIFGYAAEKILRRLSKKGMQIISKNGFYVGGGGMGPLKDGELERAAAWIKKIAAGNYNHKGE